VVTLFWGCVRRFSHSRPTGEGRGEGSFAKGFNKATRLPAVLNQKMRAPAADSRYTNPA
jgi:hypothetical protein